MRSVQAYWLSSVLAFAWGWASSAPAIDYFTENFAGGGDDFDLQNASLLLTPDGSSDRYAACTNAAVAFPTPTGSHTALALGDDAFTYIALTAGATVSVYGVAYTNLFIGSNGYITFSGGDVSRNPVTADHFAQPRVSGFMNDLNPLVGGTVLFGQESNRAVVTFDQINLFNTTDANSFQIELFFDGRIRITWLTMQTLFGVIGISEGTNTPTGFVESDIDSAYTSCLRPSYFTELFDAFDVDLSNTTLTFTPDGSESYYGLCLETNVTVFPVDPDDGTTYGFTDDDFAGTSPIGGTVSLYGASTNLVFVTSNGRVTFGSGTTVYTESLSEHFSQPGISAFFRDLNPAVGGQVSYKETLDSFVVNYLDVPEVSSSGGGVNANSFQVELFFDGSVASGTVKVTYLDMNARLGLVGLADGFDPTSVGGFTETDLSTALPCPALPGSIGNQVWIDNGLGGGLPGDGIRNGEETGMGNITVQLLDGTSTNVLDATITDENGIYTFGGLATGAYRVAVIAPAGFDFTLQDEGFNDDLDSDVDRVSGITLPIALPAGQERDDVDAGLLPPSIGFATATQTVAETVGGVAVDVTLSNTSSVPVDVPFFISGGTASEGPGADYELLTAAPLAIPAGALSNTITLAIGNDALDEADETIVLELAIPPTAMLGTTTSHVVTITDNDPPPTLDITPILVDEWASTAVFEVTLDAASGRDITVDFSAVSGSAMAGTDFEVTNGVLAISAGATNAQIVVVINNDPFDEFNEMFSLVLSNLNHAVFNGGTNTAAATIVDDDLPPTLTATDVTVPEDAGIAAFQLILSEASGRDITVDFATVDGSAVAPGDYGATSGTFTVTNGLVTTILPVAIVDDAVYETNESFQVALSNVTHATLTTGIVTGVINAKPILSDTNRFGWSTTAGWINGKASGGGAIFCGNVLGGKVWSSTVGWINLGDGTPDGGAFYSNTNAADFGVNHDGAGNLAGFAWSSTTGWIRFEQTHGKPKYEIATGRLRGYAWSSTCGWINLGENVTNSFAFLVDDPAPVLSINDLVVNENDTTATFTVTRSGSPTEVDATVQFMTADQSAVAGQDYAATNGMVTLPGTAATVQVEVGLINDGLDESDEVFTVRLTNAVHATIADGLGLGTIQDDGDAAPTININNLFVNENDGFAVFTVTLTGPSGQDIQFQFASSNITAMAGMEFVATNGADVIASGQLSTTVAVEVVNNLLDDDDSQFSLILSAISNAVPGSVVGVATIQDDDPAPFLSVGDIVVPEDAGTARFVATLSQESGRTIQFNYVTTNGAAIAPADYTATGGTFTVTSGTATTTIDVAIVLDNVKEPFEDFGVSLTMPVNVILNNPSATATITPVSTIVTNQAHAWETTAGWLNWLPTDAGAVVAESILCGYIWSPTTGWMCLGDGSPTNGFRYGNLAADDFGVNRDASGLLTGYAWSATTGWVQFEQTHGKPKIDGVTGRFSGYAWSATCGWINLGENTSNFVQTARIEILDSDGDGMDDAWEQDRFTDLTTAGPGTDFDEDGMDDLDEFASNTNPKDAGSFLRVRLLASTPTANTYQLEFDSSPARFYHIEIRPSLTGGSWADSGLGLFAPDAGTLTSQQVTLPASVTYVFRVVAVRPLTMNP